MGLFSGSFGTGLITGLATSVDKSIRTAMDKRDEEMSRARQFWQTRQAQKLDRAEEHDARAEKALNRLIDELGGNVAKGLAAYKNLGDVDSVEGYLTELDNTRLAGIKYDLNEKLKLDGIDLSQFADLSREKAFGAVRMDIKPVDIQMADMSGLAKLGLGMDDMGKGISDEVNKLIPPREREAIDGLTGAVLDRAGMVTSVKFRNELVNSMPNIKTQLAANVYQLNSGKDLYNNDLTPDAVDKLRKDNLNLTTVLATVAKADAAATEAGPTLNGFLSLYKNSIAQLETDIVWNKNTATGMVTVQTPEGMLTDNDAKNYREQKMKENDAAFVRSTLLDANGDFVNNDAKIIAGANGLMGIVDSVKQEIAAAQEQEATGETPAAGGKAPPPPPPKPEAPVVEGADQWKTAEAVVNDPQGYVDWATSTNPAFGDTAQGVAALEKSLQQSGVPQDQIDIILGPMKQATAIPAPKPKANAPARPAGGRARKNWDAKYGATHNPDGTPKA